MRLLVNGEDKDYPEVTTLSALIEQLGAKSDRIAVELNRDIVPRARWDSTPIHEGDRLEIVHFVGGGCSRSH
jgi:sulfur carrier protein